MENKNTNKKRENEMDKKIIIFMMGGPCAGKSTYVKRNLNEWSILDSDQIKEQHPSYNPEKASELHNWSSEILEDKFQEMIKDSQSFVLDGTGVNSDRMVRRMTEAKELGYKVKLIYVICSLTESLKRNKLRARKVPEKIIISKYKDIRYSFDIVSVYADKIKVFKG